MTKKKASSLEARLRRRVALLLRLTERAELASRDAASWTDEEREEACRVAQEAIAAIEEAMKWLGVSPAEVKAELARRARRGAATTCGTRRPEARRASRARRR
jgi:hypothetical protein